MDFSESALVELLHRQLAAETRCGVPISRKAQVTDLKLGMLFLAKCNVRTTPPCNGTFHLSMIRLGV